MVLLEDNKFERFAENDGEEEKEKKEDKRKAFK